MRDPLEDGLIFLTLAAQALSQDEFSKCFESKPRYQPPKNQTFYLLWLLGVAFRYGVLLPLRLLFLVGVMSFLVCLMLLTQMLGMQEHTEYLFCIGCKIWLISFGAIVRHHGDKIHHQQPHVYVANHTSFTDFFLCSSHRFSHATLAQLHGGLFGFFQKYLLTAVGSLSFNRDEQRDRVIVSERMKKHTLQIGRAPLLVFPEGTCVNNDATVLFHKGVFELGTAVVPVAIKYNKRLMDPYWNTREQSFSQHVLYLMTRWIMIADVYWLPLQVALSGETPIDFCSRVKAMISEAAGLQNLSWDGYMKNYMKSTFRDKLLVNMQKEYAKNLKIDLSEPSPPESYRLSTKPKQRSMSAMTMEELEKRSISPLQQMVFPDWLSEQALVDIKNALMNGRLSSKASSKELSNGTHSKNSSVDDLPGTCASPLKPEDDKAFVESIDRVSELKDRWKDSRDELSENGAWRAWFKSLKED